MHEMTVIVYYLLAFAAIIISSFSQILLKKAAMKQHGSFLKEYLNLYVIGAYAMFALSLLLMTISYAGLPFKLVPVLESLGYIMVMLLAFFFFGEKITKRKVIGTVCILIGIVVFNL